MSQPSKFEREVQQYLTALQEMREARHAVRLAENGLGRETDALVTFDASAEARMAAHEAELVALRAAFQEKLASERHAVEASLALYKTQLKVAREAALSCERRWLVFADRTGKSLHAEVSGTRSLRGKVDLTEADFRQTDDAEAHAAPAESVDEPAVTVEPLQPTPTVVP